jgi:o-succinylbenzoate synthase
MRIVRAEIWRVPLALKEPFRASKWIFQEKDALLVRLESADGLVGWGESGALPAPWYAPDYLDGVEAVLRQFLLPTILGNVYERIEDLLAALAWVRGHPFAKVAIEGAFWHLLAQERQMPLHALWGGTLMRVEAGTRLGIPDRLDDLLIGVQAALDRGFRRIKIKIRPGFDVQPVAAIRERFGDTVWLMVDANSSYSLARDDLAALHALDEFDLLMIEQPLGSDDILDHAALQAQMHTPICLDESISTYDAARQAIAAKACQAISIKPPRLGGFAAAQRVAELCAANSVVAWCGGMFETGVGKAFNAHLCSVSAFTLPMDDPDAHAYYDETLLRDPILLDADAHLTLPTTPGLGWRIDEDYIFAHGRQG